MTTSRSITIYPKISIDRTISGGIYWMPLVGYLWESFQSLCLYVQMGRLNNPTITSIHAKTRKIDWNWKQFIYIWIQISIYLSSILKTLVFKHCLKNIRMKFTYIYIKLWMLGVMCTDLHSLDVAWWLLFHKGWEEFRHNTSSKQYFEIAKMKCWTYNL